MHKVLGGKKYKDQKMTLLIWEVRDFIKSMLIITITFSERINDLHKKL